LGEIFYVIEIKRSTYKIDAKALEQAYEYGSFLRNKYASETSFSRVVCYVVGGEKNTVAASELLKDFSCDLVQSYFYSHPLDASQLENWLQAHS